MKITYKIILTFLVVTFAAPVGAGSFRCGTCLISPGDTRARVVSCCGEPDAVSVMKPGSGVSAGRPESYRYDSNMQIEQWVYDLRPYGFVRYLVFEDERVVRITE